MKKIILFVFLNLILTSLIIAQTTLLTEDFETDGEGSRYVSTTFDDCASLTSDYFLRTDINPYSCANGSFGDALLNVQGSNFWVSEDIDGAVGNSGNSTATLELNPLIASGYSGITVSIYMAVGRAGVQTQWELNDKVLIQAKWDAGSFTTIGQFVGDAEFGGYLRRDNDLDGVADGGAAFLTNTFTNYTFNVPGIGTNLSVRILLDGHDGSEEFAFDQIVVQGSSTPPPNFTPILANIENLSFVFTEGDAAKQVSNTLTVTDPDDVNLESALVQICLGLNTGEDVLDFTPVGGIIGSYNASTGELSLTGTSSVANYQTALRSVTYQNINTDNPSNTKREICFTVNDGTDDSNTQSRLIGIMDVISESVCLPFAESFEDNGEGVSYVSNTFNDSPGSEFFFRTNAQPIGHADAVTGVDGSYFWASEDIMGGSNGAVPGVIEFAPMMITDRYDFTFQLLMGTSNSNGIRWERNDNIEIQYNIDGGGWTTFGLFQGDAEFGGNLRVDTDNDPATFGPYGTNVPNGSASNFSFNINGTTGDEIKLRILFEQIGGSEELVFDNIRFDGNIIATNIAATTCDPAQVGVTQQTLTNQFGCDSVVIITTTLLPGDTTNLAATTCDPAQVGVTQLTLTNQFGCDSVVITTTTLLPSDVTNLVATTCDPAQVGVSQLILTNQFGCDSIVITTTTLEAEPPVITNCPEDHEVSVDENCEYIIPDFRDQITVTDNCGIAQIIQSPAPGFVMSTNNPSASTGVLITVFDTNGNSSTCSFGLYAVDNTPPVISNIPSDQILNNAPGECSQSTSWAGPTVTDNCCFSYSDIVVTSSDPSIIIDMPDGPAGYAYATFPLGTTTIYYTVPDCEGNTDEFNFTVTVNDTEAPTISNCPSTQVLNNVPGDCYQTTSWQVPTAEDNCCIQSFVVTTSNPSVHINLLGGFAFATFPVGTTTISYTATDCVGLESVCSFDVTILDNEDPLIICNADITINNDPGQCGAVVNYSTPVGIDNCPGAITSQINGLGSGAFFPVGVTTETYLVTDAAGNVDECSFTVTVIDDTPPVVNCQDYQTYLGIGGNVTIDPSTVIASATDNCEIDPSMTYISPNNFSVDGLFNVTAFVRDINGNEGNCTSEVTIKKRPTTLTNNGVFTGRYSETVTLSATLTDDLSGGTPLSGKTIKFSLGAFTGSAVTNSSGVASINVVLNQIPGNYTFSTSFDGDQIFNGNNDADPFSITGARTSVTNLGVYSGQYSDSVMLSAQLLNDVTGTPISGQSLTFGIQGIPPAVGITDASGTAAVKVRLSQSPGNYSWSTSYAGNSFYLASSATDPFTVHPEDASVTYTGVYFASTSSKTSGVADVLLSATIQDINDGSRGDISKATATFVDRDNGNAPISPALPVILINSGDSLVGNVVYNWSGVNIGSKESETFEIGIIVNDHYDRNSMSDNVMVTVSKPLDDFVTGGGYLLLANSAGTYAGDIDSKANFGFNVKFNKKGNKIQGKFQMLIRRTEGDGEHIYRIKSNKLSSLAIDPNSLQGTLTGKANVQDVTDPDNPISVAGNHEFIAQFQDNGEPGVNDLLAFTFYGNGGGLEFSTNWTGTQTASQVLAGGNIVVHSGGNGNKSAEIAINILESEISNSFELNMYPNPTRGEVTVDINSSVIMEAEVSVMNIAGQEVFRKKYKASEQIRFDLTGHVSGIYMVFIDVGGNQSVKKLILDNQ